MNRFNILGALVAVLLIGGLSGCGGGNKLVGSWEGISNGVPGTLTFKSDNSFAMEATNPKDASKKMTLTGDYTLEGDKITMTLKDVQLTGASAQEQAGAKQALSGDVNKPTTSTVAWKSDTEMELIAPEGSKTTFKKKS